MAKIETNVPQGASGSVYDRRPIFGEMVNSSEPIDLIIGDWMSEGNMPASSTRKLAGTAFEGVEIFQ